MTAKGVGIPTEQDWGVIPADDLDLQSAYRDFFGKSNDEIRPFFARCVIELADDLRWMPAVPFRYYVKGFADLIMSGEFHQMNAPDIGSVFLDLVEEQMRQRPNIIEPVMDYLFPVVEYVSKHQKDFRADADIYGDFLKKGRVINGLWEAYKRTL